MIEVERTINRSGHVLLGRHVVLAAEILGGQRVGVRIDGQTLAFFDQRVTVPGPIRPVPPAVPPGSGLSRPADSS